MVTQVIKAQRHSAVELGCFSGGHQAVSYQPQSPFFVCCSGRSGSSHLRLMLDHHPQLSCTDEVGYITELVSDAGDIPDGDVYRRWLDTNRIFQSRQFTVNPDLDFHGLINDFLCQQQDCSNKVAVGAISHFDFIRLWRLWPEARFIHLVRDGRDVACSWMKEMHHVQNPWIAAARWRVAEQAWERLAQHLPPHQYLEITYEDLINDTVATLERVCQFLGVAYDGRMLEFAQPGSPFRLPNPRFVGLWRSQLSPREVQLAEAQLGDLLPLRGYELSGWPRLIVTSWDAQRFRWAERWFRWRWRTRFFGLGLVLAEMLSQGLKLKGWQRRVKQKMNALEIARLKRR